MQTDNTEKSKPIIRWQLNDTIAVVVGPDKWGTIRREVVFPYVSSCRICGGVDSYFKLTPQAKVSYEEADRVRDAVKALRIADMQYGMKYLHFNDNPAPQICSNECQAMKEKYSNLSPRIDSLLVEDTKWKLASDSAPSRGWHSYERELIFTRPLTSEELNELSMHLKYDKKSPHGQGLPMVRLKKDTTYRATCYCDSGD